jgi:hypothetical protein
MTDDLEGNSCGLIEVLCRRLNRWTEENHDSLCQDSRCCAQDFNLAPPEYESRLALPVHRRSRRGDIDPRWSCCHVQTRVRLMKPCKGHSAALWANYSDHGGYCTSSPFLETSFTCIRSMAILGIPSLDRVHILFSLCCKLNNAAPWRNRTRFSGAFSNVRFILQGL